MTVKELTEFLAKQAEDSEVQFGDTGLYIFTEQLGVIDFLEFIEL